MAVMPRTTTRDPWDIIMSSADMVNRNANIDIENEEVKKRMAIEQANKLIQMERQKQLSLQYDPQIQGGIAGAEEGAREPYTVRREGRQLSNQKDLYRYQQGTETEEEGKRLRQKYGITEEEYKKNPGMMRELYGRGYQRQPVDMNSPMFDSDMQADDYIEQGGLSATHEKRPGINPKTGKGVWVVVPKGTPKSAGPQTMPSTTQQQGKTNPLPSPSQNGTTSVGKGDKLGTKPSSGNQMMVPFKHPDGRVEMVPVEDGSGNPLPADPVPTDKLRSESQRRGGMRSDRSDPGVRWLRTAEEAPSQFAPIYNAAAERYGLDPNLLVAQGYQESGFRTNARSPVGAYGISQFMPGTAREYGIDPRDPEQSIHGQAKYMAKSLDRYDGNVGLALASYNAGTGKVDNVLAGRARFKPETEKYVKAITGYTIRDFLNNPNLISGWSGGTSSQPKDEPQQATPNIGEKRNTDDGTQWWVDV